MCQTGAKSPTCGCSWPRLAFVCMPVASDQPDQELWLCLGRPPTLRQSAGTDAVPRWSLRLPRPLCRTALPAAVRVDPRRPVEPALGGHPRADRAADGHRRRPIRGLPVPPHFLGAIVLDQQRIPAGFIAMRHVIDGQPGPGHRQRRPAPYRRTSSSPRSQRSYGVCRGARDRRSVRWPRR